MNTYSPVRRCNIKAAHGRVSVGKSKKQVTQKDKRKLIQQTGQVWDGCAWGLRKLGGTIDFLILMILRTKVDRSNPPLKVRTCKNLSYLAGGQSIKKGTCLFVVMRLMKQAVHASLMFWFSKTIRYFHLGIVICSACLMEMDLIIHDAFMVRDGMRELSVKPNMTWRSRVWPQLWMWLK